MTDFQTQVMVLAAIVFGLFTLLLATDGITEAVRRFFGMDDGSAG